MNLIINQLNYKTSIIAGVITDKPIFDNPNVTK